MKPSATPARSARKTSSVSSFSSFSRPLRNSQNSGRPRPPVPSFTPRQINNNDSDDKNLLTVPSCDAAACNSSFQVPQTPYRRFKMPLACSTQTRTPKKPRRISPTEENSSFEEDPNVSLKLLRAKYLMKCMDESFMEERIGKSYGTSGLRSKLEKRENEYMGFDANISAVRDLSKYIHELDATQAQLEQSLGHVGYKSKDLVSGTLRKACDLLPLKGIAVQGEKSDGDCVCDKKNLLLQDMVDMEEALAKINVGSTGQDVEEVLGKYREMEEKVEGFGKSKQQLDKDLGDLVMLTLQANSVALAQED